MKFSELSDAEKDFLRLKTFVQEGHYKRVNRILRKYGGDITDVLPEEWAGLLCVELLMTGNSEAGGLAHRIIRLTDMPEGLYQEVQKEYNKRLRDTDSRHFDFETAVWLRKIQNSETYEEWMKAIKLK